MSTAGGAEKKEVEVPPLVRPMLQHESRCASCGTFFPNPVEAAAVSKQTASRGCPQCGQLEVVTLDEPVGLGAFHAKRLAWLGGKITEPQTFKVGMGARIKAAEWMRDQDQAFQFYDDTIEVRTSTQEQGEWNNLKVDVDPNEAKSPPMPEKPLDLTSLIHVWHGKIKAEMEPPELETRAADDNDGQLN